VRDWYQSQNPKDRVTPSSRVPWLDGSMSDRKALAREIAARTKPRFIEISKKEAPREISRGKVMNEETTPRMGHRYL
jgi:hypothetical protein